MGLINIDAIKKLMQSPNYTKPTTVPKASPTTPTTGAVGALAGVTLPNMNKQPLPTGLTGSNVTVPNMNLSSANPASNVTIPNGYSASNPSGGYQPSPTGGVTLPRTEQTLNTQSGLVNTPWNYKAADDQSLQAAIRDADNKLLINQKNTNAQLRATGQGKSSYSETVANQLANQSAENIANNILPQYAQQAYQQYQDSIGNQRNLYSDYNQQDFQNPITESSVTGNYMPAEATAAYKQLLANKQAAESPTITRDERTAISSETDALRDTLKRLGIDISGLGADKTSAQAGAVNPGIRTLAGQTNDASVNSQNIANEMSKIDLKNYPETSQLKIKQLQQQVESGKLTNEQAQYQLKELTDPNSIPNKLSALDLEMKQIDASMYSDVKKAEYEQLQKTIAQIGKTQPVTEYDKRLQELDLEKAELQVEKLRSEGSAAPSTVAEDYAVNYIDKSVVRNEDGDITNLDAVKGQILSNPNLKDDEIAWLYQRYQIPLPAGFSGN